VDRRILTVALAAVLLAGCGSAGPPAGPGAVECGWDLGSEAGRAASAERLNFVNEWLMQNPGITPPEPSSSYWRGECPTPSAPMPPPDHEDEAPVD
jgi:hypothetical protein